MPAPLGHGTVGRPNKTHKKLQKRYLYPLFLNDINDTVEQLLKVLFLPDCFTDLSKFKFQCMNFKHTNIEHLEKAV